MTIVENFSEGDSAVQDLKQTNVDPYLLINEMCKGFVLLEADAALIKDPKTYVIRRTNAYFNKMFDIQNNNLDKTLSSLLPLNDELADELVKVMTTAKASSHEIFVAELDRWYMLAIFSPQKHYVALISEDITEKKKIEEKLDESEETMRLTLDVAGEGLWQWRAEDELIHHNKKWSSILGFSTDTETHTLDDFK